MIFKFQLNNYSLYQPSVDIFDEVSNEIQLRVMSLITLIY